MIYPLLVGNWKMYKTIGEAVGFASRLRQEVSGLQDRNVVIAPPFTALKPVAEVLAGSSVGLAAQNIHEQSQGAFTGEISGPMLLDAGCSHVIIGHSERRTLFAESDELIHAKVSAAMKCELIPILCVGETIQQRDAGKALDIIKRQLKEALHDLAFNDINRLVIAYEPVWAIGTGRTASPDQAQETHWFIRQWINESFGMTVAKEIRILYGGSVHPDNISALMAMQDINGALIGGASLTLDSFIRIIKYDL